MTAATPRWRRLEPDTRREQILACALRLFERQPYAAVSTGEIARAAGVARALINHYFGTKRELYLEVVRRLAFVPPFAVEGLPSGDVDERVDASIERLLGVAWRHRSMWLATVSAEGLGRDEEVERILAEADEIAADRVLEAMAISSDEPALRAVVRSYGALVKAATREWLVRETLSRAQVKVLLARTLLALLRDTFPLVREAGETPGAGT